MPSGVRTIPIFNSSRSIGSERSRSKRHECPQNLVKLQSPSEDYLDAGAEKASRVQSTRTLAKHNVQAYLNKRRREIEAFYARRDGEHRLSSGVASAELFSSTFA